MVHTAKSNRKGFTMIEVMVVLSITAMLTVGALSSYKTFNSTKRLEADTEQLVELIELAKKSAIAGEKTCVSYGGSYRVSWTVDTITLTPVGCTSLTTYVLEGNVFETTPTSVSFFPVGKGTNLSSDICVLIKNESIDQCRKVTIEKSGTVSHEANPTCSCL